MYISGLTRLLQQRSKHPREMVITLKASISHFPFLHSAPRANNPSPPSTSSFLHESRPLRVIAVEKIASEQTLSKLATPVESPAFDRLTLNLDRVC